MTFARRPLEALIALAFLFAIPVGTVSAFTVSPMVMEIETTGGQNSGQFTISNRDGDQPVPIGLQALKVELQTDGSVEEVDASAELLLFPPSVIIPAGEEQVIRVQYLGDGAASVAQAYRIDIEDLPLDLEKEASGLQFKTQFRALLFVIPPGARPQVEFLDISPIDEKGYVDVKVNNRGNHYAALSSGGLRLRNGAGETIEMRGGEIASRVQGSIIFPNAERTLSILVPDGFEDLKSVEIVGN